MKEGIEYLEIGTVDVTFDDETRHLTRPKFRQFKYFSTWLEQDRQAATDELKRLRRRVEDAQQRHEDESTPEAKAELEEIRAELHEFSKDPFYDKTIPILAEMFTQLGDKPLPEDPDDWPAWLAANSSIPGEILSHWRNVPKASGSNETNE